MTESSSGSMTAWCRALLLIGGLAALPGPAQAQEGLSRERGARVDGTRPDSAPRPEGGLRGRERVDGTATGGPTHWIVEPQGGAQPMVLPVPVPVPVPRHNPPATRPPIRAGSGPNAAQ